MVKTKVKYNSVMRSWKDYVMIVFGLALYAFGFTAFILPHKIVIGGLSGVGTLVFFATDGVVPVAVTQYACNLLLLAIAYRLVGKTFVMRTIFGATIASLFIGILQPVFMGLAKPLIADISMSAILGGILCGIGVGTIFIHNGSSGGTDIVAAMVSKVSNVSVGRTMVVTDMLIVSSSLLLPFDGPLAERIEVRIPLIIYGFIITYLMGYMTDMVINGNRQAMQFVIFSHKWAEIADLINQEARRGVTVVEGKGWYTKQEVKMLLVWCRKTESVTISRIVKSIDENAFIAQTHANGVYGNGFDTMRVKKIKPKNTETPADQG